MSYESNPYYHPDKYDLTILGEVQWGEPSYDFDLTVVWQGSDGQLYMADDSGCSCPSPFEETSFESLQRVTKHEALEYLTNRGKAGDDDWEDAKQRYAAAGADAPTWRYYGSTEDAASLIERLAAL
jgi:hypothetical protein